MFWTVISNNSYSLPHSLAYVWNTIYLITLECLFKVTNAAPLPIVYVSPFFQTFADC